MRLLVAEDERDLNEIILQKLKSEGYSVDACYDGQKPWIFSLIQSMMQYFWIL